MRSSLIKMGAVLGVCVAIIMSSGFIKASTTLTQYSFTVPVFSDSETADRTKDSSSSAFLEATTVKGGKLVAWIEKTNGDNVSEKLSYSMPADMQIDYNNVSSVMGSKVHLNISTSATTFNTVTTTGHWAPDKY